MTKLNTIDQIKKEEEKASQTLSTAHKDVSKEIESVKNRSEEKMTNLKEELEDEIKKIFTIADQEISKIKQKITKETSEEVAKVKKVPQGKKIKAAELIINKVKS